MPQGYFNGEASVIASAFREYAVGERRHDLIADFPMRALEGGLGFRRQRAAIGFYERCFDYLKEHKRNGGRRRFRCNLLRAAVGGRHSAGGGRTKK
jgi:hypothetical protein